MTRFQKIKNREYFIVNLLIVGITVIIFGYSLFFDPIKQNYPVHSLCDKFNIPEKKCVSKGLSRAFSYLVRFEPGKAQKLNKYSIRLFLFFLFQFLLRAILLVANPYKKVIYVDIAISVALFLWVFYPFITNLFIVN